LGRFEPVHVVIDVAHACRERRARRLHTHETLSDSLPFATREQLGDLLIFPDNRTHDWIRPDCGQDQVLAQSIERDLLHPRKLSLGEFAEFHVLG